MDFRCTYRVQLTPELGFRRVRQVVLPYLRDLGVSHLYLSPVLQARAGSTHGEPLFDDAFLLVFNAHSEPVVFTLPTRRFGSRWQVELATGDAPDGPLGARALLAVQEHSLVLLRRV